MKAGADLTDDHAAWVYLGSDPTPASACMPKFLGSAATLKGSLLVAYSRQMGMLGLYWLLPNQDTLRTRFYQVSAFEDDGPLLNESVEKQLPCLGSSASSDSVAN